ncbi:MAG: MFS transporter [Clostridia bacterium]
MEKKLFGNKELMIYCASDFGKGIFGGMITNYLIYFYQPTIASGLPLFITQGLVFFGFLTMIGLIKATGHIFDAITDPIIAHLSDKCKHKSGRRMIFMKWSAIPYGLCALLVFFPPMQGVNVINNIWVGVFMWGYFLFYTLFMIPHGALLPEIINDPKKRVKAYSASSFAYVVGSAFVYATPAIVKFVENTFLTSKVLSWQITFIFLAVLGVASLLITAFGINEKDYVHSKIPSLKMMDALKGAFSNKQFRMLTFGQLFQTISMAFFQATIMYYITELLGLPLEQSSVIMAASIAGSICLYPFVVWISKKYNKKVPLIIASFVFVFSYIVIIFADKIVAPPLLKGIGFAILVSYPFAAMNILPGALMSDIIQYDTLKSGVNKEGIFSAAKSFVTKLGQSIALMIVPSVLTIGAAANENVGNLGIKMTAVVAAVFCAASIIFFLVYNDKMVIKYIEDSKKENDLAPKE